MGRGSAAEGLGVIILVAIGGVIYIITSILTAIGDFLYSLCLFIAKHWIAIVLIFIAITIITTIIRRYRYKHRFERIQSKVDAMPDGLEKDILNTYLQRQILLSKRDSLIKKIKVLTKRSSKNQNLKWTSELNMLNSELNLVEQKINSNIICADCNLTANQENLFKELKSCFIRISNCDRLWAGTMRPEIKIGYSEYMSTPYEIPIIKIGKREFNIFPKIIMCISSQWNIELYPIDSIKAIYHEEDTLIIGSKPKDATWDWYRWDYERVNGGPDRRYKNNNCYHYYSAGKIAMGKLCLMCSNTHVAEGSVKQINQYIKSLVSPGNNPNNNPQSNNGRNNNNNPQRRNPSNNSICDNQFETIVKLILSDYSIEKLNENFLFVNILDDMHAFENERSYRFILKSMIESRLLLDITKPHIDISEKEKLLQQFVSNTGLEAKKCRAIIECILKHNHNGQL